MYITHLMLDAMLLHVIRLWGIIVSNLGVKCERILIQINHWWAIDLILWVYGESERLSVIIMRMIINDFRGNEGWFSGRRVMSPINPKQPLTPIKPFLKWKKWKLLSSSVTCRFIVERWKWYWSIIIYVIWFVLDVTENKKPCLIKI